jgi:hypothetical protein
MGSFEGSRMVLATLFLGYICLPRSSSKTVRERGALHYPAFDLRPVLERPRGVWTSQQERPVLARRAALFVKNVLRALF